MNHKAWGRALSQPGHPDSDFTFHSADQANTIIYSSFKQQQKQTVTKLYSNCLCFFLQI